LLDIFNFINYLIYLIYHLSPIIINYFNY